MLVRMCVCTTDTKTLAITGALDCGVGRYYLGIITVDVRAGLYQRERVGVLKLYAIWSCATLCATHGKVNERYELWYGAFECVRFSNHQETRSCLETSTFIPTLPTYRATSQVSLTLKSQFSRSFYRQYRWMNGIRGSGKICYCIPMH